jgi:hypothetical protein
VDRGTLETRGGQRPSQGQGPVSSRIGLLGVDVGPGGVRTVILVCRLATNIGVSSTHTLALSERINDLSCTDSYEGMQGRRPQTSVRVLTALIAN